MSENDPGTPQQPLQQPEQPDNAEYLEAGGGSPLTPGTPAPTSAARGGKRGLLIGGGVAVLALVGVGAWAAAQFFATGAQPAEALPATTIGYASVDLDPSGAQKIEALRTLNKFPAFKDELDLDTDDDIRRAIFEKLDLPEGCQIFYDEDIEPWLGERFAIAAVDTGAKDPEVVAVAQVKDADAADQALTKLRDCSTEGETSGGWVIDGDWAVIAEDRQGAQAVVDAAGESTLADDPEFKDLTAAAGSAGIVTLYAAPEAGSYFGREAGDVVGMADELTGGFFGTRDDLGDGRNSPDGQASGSGWWTDFQGAAVSVRFDDGALEIESAGDFGPRLGSFFDSDRGADVVETLPADTAAAIGVGFEDGWLTKVVEQVAALSGGKTSASDLFAEASEMTGLDLPRDAETLLGRSAALSFGSDFDPEAFFNSSDGSELPVALKVQGDADGARGVLKKIIAQDPETEDYLGIDANGEVFVIGPDAGYRQAVLREGSLGDNEIYQDVIRESDQASAVLFVNFNAGDDWLVRTIGDSDPTVVENLKPLAGFGIAAWRDDDRTHTVLRLTTD